MSTATIVGVYRAENAALVERLLQPALEAGWTTAWWALDRVAATLEPFTVGEGPGEKLPLLDAAIKETMRLRPIQFGSRMKQKLREWWTIRKYAGRLRSSRVVVRGGWQREGSNLFIRALKLSPLLA
jgi:hypothetical protein